MFPGGYLPDYARTRVRANATPAAISAQQRAAAAASSSSGVVSVSALPNTPVVDADGHTCAAATGRVDTKFALPPALITCLVRHIDSQHNVLATPAVVERCLRDLQRRLMPWVPVERVFGSTMRATVPGGASATAHAGAAFSTAGRSPASMAGAAIPGGSLTAPPATSTPQAGSYLAGSHVRLQLAKTTDNSVVVAIGASVLHLLFYAVDEPESRPSHLAHVVLEWLEALKTKGEEHDCMVLLVHGDLVAASEAAARMAEEAQRVGGPQQQQSSSSSAHSSTATPLPHPPLPTVSQDKVDAASAQLRRYYKELQDLKLSRQQVCAYMPNETPMRILERLRPAVIARGGRLRQALQVAAARRRQYPQDPSTKPGMPAPPLSAAPSTSTAATTSAPKHQQQPSSASPRLTGILAEKKSGGGGSSPARVASPSVSPAAAQYFNVQALWRTGYDLVVHYLQYGLVFDAREALEHLYLEYYNNSDDYVFLRTPIETLQRLGRVPNLFDSHGHAGWGIGRTGYPTAIEPGAELLEGLLLLASAEMTCSLLLGETAAALARYNTFVQVTREKFEEWTAMEATAMTPKPAGHDPQQQDPVGGCPLRITSYTFQQFFLLQCYLSGLRMWWPTSGLCRPRRVTPSRLSPAPPPTAANTPDDGQLPPGAAAATPTSTTRQQQEQQSLERRDAHDASAAAPRSHDDRSTASMFSPLTLPAVKLSTLRGTANAAVLPAPEVVDPEDGSVAVALSTSPLLLPATGASFSASTFTTTNVTSAPRPNLDGGASPLGAAAALDGSQALSDSANANAVRYSMTNPSFAAPGGTSMSGASFRGLGSFAARSEVSSAERLADGGLPLAAPLLIPARTVPGAAMRDSGGEARTDPAVPSPTQGAEEDEESEQDDDDDAEAAELADFDLHYLVAGSEDTAQLTVGYLVDLAVSTGLVAPSMEPEELSGTAEAIQDAMESGNVALVRALKQRQCELRRSCAELASLLERARDSLAVVAHDLGYNPFRRCAEGEEGVTAANDDGHHRDEEKKRKNDGGVEGPVLSPISSAATTATTTTTFADVAELSSPAQALRLWRVLAAMAALALRIGHQRRREFHLYARLAVTFLSDHPAVTATIVADRLLPYVRTLGWRTIELVVRRLYVEAREQLMRRAGLLDDLLRGPESAATATRGKETEKHARLVPKAWLRVFRTGPAFALYRECILVLISNSKYMDGLDKSQRQQQVSAASVGGEQLQPGPSPPSPAVATPRSPASYMAAGIVSADDAVGSLDTRLFAERTPAQWWIALLRVDAVVLSAFYANEPPEYPLSNFTAPLMTRVERQRPSSSAAAAAASSAGALVAEVEEVVRLSFSMACAVNPLIGADGAVHLRLASSSSSSTPQRPKTAHQSAVRLQLTLESRKDWEDEEEATHVVHLHDCIEASYDTATRQLRTVFLFPICHAGVYRVRRLRLCNGNTRLAQYPQHGSCSSSEGGRSGDRSSVRALMARGGLLSGQEAAAAARLRAALDASFLPASRAPVLRVPEPRSSVHLKLTLPEEAHCFADSVDYMTLDVDLEDPLRVVVPISSPSGADNEANAPPVEAARDDADEDSSNDVSATDEAAAECSCFYEASPGNVLLPLSVAANAGGRHAHRTGASAGEEAIEGGSQQRPASVSPGYRAFLSGDAVGDGGAELALRQRGPALVAAVVLGTPNAYRVRGAGAGASTASTGAAGNSSRVNLGASFSHHFAPRSPDASMASVGGWKGHGNSLAHRTHTGHHPHHHFHTHHHHNSNSSTLPPPHRRSPADAFLSSSLRSASHPFNISSSSLGYGVSSTAATTAPPHRMSGEARYKSVFKNLRISTEGAAATPPAAAAALHDGLASSPASGSTSNVGGAADRQRSRSAHHHSHNHHHHSRSRSPAISEPSAHDGGNAGHSFSAAMMHLGPASPLREVDADTLELLLHHPTPAGRDAAGRLSATTSSAAALAKPSPFATSPSAQATTAAVSCTSIPIHLGQFLNCLPAPEVQTHNTGHLRSAATAVASLLEAVSTPSSDHLRESVIRLFPVPVGTSSGTGGGEGEKSSAAMKVPITRMRLRLPLLPLLLTPAAAASVGRNASAASAGTPPPPSTEGEGGSASPTAPSGAEAAKQARIAFTCMRGREPSTTSLSVTLPFQLAVHCDYAFKHFQGRVYCLVRMTNLLRTTSLWLRGAVLRVLDPEPSYEIVRVCDVYNELLVTEWKPQEEWCVLYELDLIASFHPVQPECAHQVQLQVFYSSWEKSFLTTQPEDRLVLRTVLLPPTEATAESVELIHGDAAVSHSSPNPQHSPFHSAAAAAARSPSMGYPRVESDNTDDLLQQLGSDTPGGFSPSLFTPPASSQFGGENTSPTGCIVPPITAAMRSSADATVFGGPEPSTIATSGISGNSDGSVTRSATQVAHSVNHSHGLSKGDGSASEDKDGADNDGSSSSSSRTANGKRCGSSNQSGNSSSNSSVAASGAVHFNVVTLRHLEETCNTVLGPVATFHSKHLCVFSIVMYAESPWMMRFGAATNYLAKAPSTPLSATASTVGDRGPLPRSSVQPSRAAAPSQQASTSTFDRSLSSSAPNAVPATGDSFFGNAMVDQPSDFVFVAGEPVRFCVRLQPLAQNWPEDANMEETFFIRLKYNPAEWMVVGKQRDRRTLSLMEEVTVYFNAVPLLPLASAEAGDEAENSADGAAARSHRSVRAADDEDDAEEMNKGEDTAAMARGDGERRGKAVRSSRPLAGHAVRDEGILQTPTVEMFWERKKPLPGAAATPGHVDAVMGEPVLIDVVQFRTWVRVRKHGH